MAPRGTAGRRLLFAAAVAAYIGVFAAFYVFESPLLGIGAFFYLPICLVALVSDEIVGAVAGLVATAFYMGVIVLGVHKPHGGMLVESSTIRLLTFVGVGALVGWFAHRNRELVTQLRELASKDFLTELGNARVFDEHLARRCGSGRPFTLVLADIDNLKQVNDVHGHSGGNAAIKRVADAFRGVASPGDDLARVGGDEFALLTDLPVDEALLVCSRLARALDAEDLHVSFGATASPDDGIAAVELFRKADDRLFAAKLVRRNRRTVVALGS